MKYTLLKCIFLLYLGLASTMVGASALTAIAPAHPHSSDTIVIQYIATSGSSPVTILASNITVTGNVVDVMVTIPSSGFSVGGSTFGQVSVDSLPPGIYTVRLFISFGTTANPGSFALKDTKTLVVTATNAAFYDLQVVGYPAESAGYRSLVMTWNNCGSRDTPQVSVSGNVVTVLQKYSAECFAVGKPVPVIIPLGYFQAGAYRLNFISTPPSGVADATISVPFNVTAISSGFTGAWYDPAQSGQGLFLEVLPGDTLLAWWFTFTPDGKQQAWFGGTGPIVGNEAVVTATLATGGQFNPNFDPVKIVRSTWGTLDFQIVDCNHLTLYFNSTLGYGSNQSTGSVYSPGMNLTRLTQPAGLSCP